MEDGRWRIAFQTRIYATNWANRIRREQRLGSISTIFLPLRVFPTISTFLAFFFTKFRLAPDFTWFYSFRSRAVIRYSEFMQEDREHEAFIRYEEKSHANIPSGGY